jgi:DNA-binding transcriptional LysR family regulator
MLSLLDLRRMRYFVAVAEELHFRRAAERLHISQPPLSQQIKALEQELDVALFERNRQRVYLTQAGRLLLERARRILADVEAARAELRATVAGQAGELRVGFTGSSGLMPFLHRALSRFRTDYPGVQVTLQDMPSLKQVEAVHKRELDIGVVRKPPMRQGAGVEFQLLCEDVLVLAVHEKNPLAARRSVRMKQLAGEAFISYPREAGISLFQKVHEMAAAADFFPNIVQEARDSSTIIGLVASGLGVAIVPESLRCIRLRGVRFVDFADAGARSALHVAIRRGERSVLMSAMRTLLRQESGSRMSAS